VVYTTVARNVSPSLGLPIPLSERDKFVLNKKILKFDNTLPLNFLCFLGFFKYEEIF